MAKSSEKSAYIRYFSYGCMVRLNNTIFKHL